MLLRVAEGARSWLRHLCMAKEVVRATRHIFLTYLWDKTVTVQRAQRGCNHLCCMAIKYNTRSSDTPLNTDLRSYACQLS